jgi:hypothetical protein
LLTTNRRSAPRRRRAARHGRAAGRAVPGEAVRTDDAAEVQRRVPDRLFDHCAEQQGIEVTDVERAGPGLGAAPPTSF